MIYGEQDAARIASDMSNTIAFYDLYGEEIYSEFPVDIEIQRMLTDAKEGNICYQFENLNNRQYVLVAGQVLQNDIGVFMLTGMDVEKVLEQQEQIIKNLV